MYPKIYCTTEYSMPLYMNPFILEVFSFLCLCICLCVCVFVIVNLCQEAVNSALREWILKVQEVKSEMEILFTHFEK